MFVPGLRVLKDSFMAIGHILSLVFGLKNPDQGQVLTIGDILAREAPVLGLKNWGHGDGLGLSDSFMAIGLVPALDFGLKNPDHGRGIGLKDSFMATGHVRVHQSLALRSPAMASLSLMDSLWPLALFLPLSLVLLTQALALAFRTVLWPLATFLPSSLALWTQAGLGLKAQVLVKVTSFECSAYMVATVNMFSVGQLCIDNNKK